MIPKQYRSRRGYTPFALVLVAFLLLLVQAFSATEARAGATQETSAFAAPVACAERGSTAHGVATPEWYGPRVVELSTPARLASKDASTRAGTGRDCASTAANLHLRQTIRAELNYRVLLQRGRSSTARGYTSTPPPISLA